MSEQTGGCMCGAVRFTATVSPRFSACYCKMCQRWSSGTFMGVSTEAFEVTEGADVVKVFRSSEWAERTFCGICGSNLTYRALQSDVPSVAFGALDDTGALQVAWEYHVDQKPAGFSLADDTHAMTEAETLRHFGVDAEDGP